MGRLATAGDAGDAGTAGTHVPERTIPEVGAGGDGVRRGGGEKGKGKRARQK